MDAEGDRLAGSRSLALRLGSEPAIRISAGIFGLVVAITSLPFLFRWLGWPYGIPILLMDCAILYSTVRLLSDQRADARRKYLRWIYLSGSAAILVILMMRMFI
jgi:4-hydroxybenzoate polyprenyltransferase